MAATGAEQPAGELSIGMLGPLRVEVGGHPVTLTANRLRTVLAVLALSAGEPVPVRRLAAAMWGVEQPDHPRRAVNLYLTRLRARLGQAAIRTDPAGYTLVVGPDQVDALRFARLLQRAAGTADPATERATLHEALDLWRGTPFEDLRSDLLDELDMPRLVEQRMTALERRIELDLAAGLGTELVTELQELTTRHPLRENLWAHLMTALYRAGRQADALATYQRLFRLLADQLGVQPGQAVQDVHRAVLAGGPQLDPVAGHRVADQPVPRQLPAGPHQFTGRLASLDSLDAMLAGDRTRDGNGGRIEPATVMIGAIAGTAGVGKTALAMHWAHRVADRFPDGQLYVNLRGFDLDARPVTPDEAVRGFLTALGVPASRIPNDLPAQVALYRSMVAGRRMLVVLDNACDAEQTRPLLPGTVGCLVLITSRNQLTGLVARDGAHLLVLDVLTPAEGLELLAARLGAARVSAERPAAEEIVEGCARLPLALAVVAARAAVHSTFPLAALAGELRGALDVLAGDDPATDLRVVFDWSYRTLTPAAGRMFRLLGLNPGPDTSVPLAASLTGLPSARARTLLAELARIHLIEEHAPGRYTFHDLLRTYARELAAGTLTDDGRDRATRRLLDHYVHSAVPAARLLNPNRWQTVVPPLPLAGVAPERPADSSEALAWFAAEDSGLLAALDGAVAAGLNTHAWQLAWALGGYLPRAGRVREWVEIQRVALEVVERTGDAREHAWAHRSLARAYRQVGRFDEAHEHMNRALDLYTGAGDRAGMAHTHHSLGQLYEMREKPRDALDHAQRAFEIFQEIGDSSGAASALNGMGWCRTRLGDHERALADCEEALRLQQTIGDRYGEATTWDSLGYIHGQLGGYEQAVTCCRRGIALHHDGGDRVSEADTTMQLGDTHRAFGNHAAAERSFRQAIQILDEINQPTGPARAKLIDLLAAGCPRIAHHQSIRPDPQEQGRRSPHT
ncbi:AfsR/SARP family transcriptional regulator [Virgisporangium aurantiacum]|uniref:SARP family transcriptional regulator n=1 Tax=Virgisporangium aurantiacum TaxID=175570 RepID=A0A8J3ZGZ2_9ACTN|nr:tetratricopeptide repeat protein [Virgisporangium aurantiacum]GIJ63631.1 SARP family transcriptional regulator [Virgisporangium aurantiacum]